MAKAPKKPELEEVIRAVIVALGVPRDRLGRLRTEVHNDDALTLLAREYNIPHGGLDRIDKAVMVLQAAIGEQPRSIMDR